MNDSTWAHKKRARLRLILYIVIGVPFVIYLMVRLYQPPTCFDGKQNQNEVEIDCGGACENYCPSQINPLHTSWVDMFKVSDDWWSAVAYIENPNFDKQTDGLAYQFTVYDKNNTPFITRKGVTAVYQEPIFALFEGRLATEGYDPDHVTFEWLSAPVWYKVHQTYEVTTEEQKLTHEGVKEKLEVTLRNHEPVSLRDVRVIAIVYDTNKNAMASSHTYIEMLNAFSKQRISFSWPRPFPRPVGRIEIIPRVLPQE